MARVAADLREALVSILEVERPDSPALRRLIDSYRDIARELGQQHDVERTLRDIFPSRLAAARRGHVAVATASHSSRNISPSQTSQNAPSR